MFNIACQGSINEKKLVYSFIYMSCEPVTSFVPNLVLLTIHKKTSETPSDVSAIFPHLGSREPYVVSAEEVTGNLYSL
jgi:hypothetical protein